MSNYRAKVNQVEGTAPPRIAPYACIASCDAIYNPRERLEVSSCSSTVSRPVRADEVKSWYDKVREVRQPQTTTSTMIPANPFMGRLILRPRCKLDSLSFRALALSCSARFLNSRYLRYLTPTGVKFAPFTKLH